MNPSLAVQDLLLARGIVSVGREIDGPLAAATVASLLALSRRDRAAPIAVWINSAGGDVASGLAILDALRALPNPVTTTVTGQARGVAAALLACGARGQRLALPSARIALALGSSSPSSLEAAAETRARRAALAATLATVTGRPAEELERDLDRSPTLSPAEAIAAGLLDAVVERLPD